MRSFIAGVIALMICASASVSAFAEESTTVLTIDDAVKYTLAADTEYLNLLDTGTLNNLGRNNTIEGLYYDGNSDPNASRYLNAYIQLMQYDTKLALQSDNQKQKELSLQNTLTKYFMNVISAEKALELSQLSLKNAQTDLNILKTKARLGLISQSAYNTAVADYEKTAMGITERENSIADAYTALNQMMGKPVDSRYTLELSYEYAEMDEVDLERMITKAISNSSTVKQRQSEFDIAVYKLEQAWWVFSSSVKTNEDLEIQATQARRALNDAKEEVRQSMSTLYKEIRAAELQIKTNKLELTKMREQLRIKEVELGLGRITALELEKYRVQVMQQEETIRQAVYNHGLLVWQLENMY